MKSPASLPALATRETLSNHSAGVCKRVKTQVSSGFLLGHGPIAFGRLTSKYQHQPTRPCRKRRPSAREDGGVSGVSSSCGARGGFLPTHDEDLREPLVRRQGNQVSMRVARWSASWLSSHGRGLGPRDALKKDSRGLSRGAAGPQ